MEESEAKMVYTRCKFQVTHSISSQCLPSLTAHQQAVDLMGRSLLVAKLTTIGLYDPNLTL